MDKLKEIKNILNEKLNKKQRIVILIALTALAFLILTKDNKNTEVTVNNEENIGNITETEKYIKNLEESLSDIICAITGEDSVKIMITAENSYEKVYAKETEENGEKKGEAYGIVKNSSQSQSALILKEIEPEIKGVAVVTNKAENFLIKEQIIEAVKTVLGISASKVSVVPLYSNYK